jgi:signal transduction histidine kinase
VRPLARLTSIRAKLGSTIVFAVAMTLILVFFFLAYALRDTPRDSELIKMYATARGVATNHLTALPLDTSVVYRAADGTEQTQGPKVTAELPVFTDQTPHSGISGAYEYVAVPKLSSGAVEGTIYVLRPAPGRGIAARFAATIQYLETQWWQLLLAGVIAAAIALVMARILALGMTQPLREMASAATKMATGDYSQRVETPSKDEVGQLAAAFNRMSGELDSVEQLRRELVANVSHELKTPITALRAHLENLLDGVEKPDPANLQIMLTQSDRLTRLVEQLLELSRLESGDLPFEPRALPLSSLVTDVVSEVRVSRADREVSVDNQVPAELAPVWADPERVHQVLFNLLDNAVRFTPPGGRVLVTAQRQNGSCEVTVADTGPGIPAEHLPRLFERFYRVDSARSAKDGGTGIGLAIARSVVEAHGGHIRAESEVGRGSAFTFDLPVAPREPDRRSE